MYRKEQCHACGEWFKDDCKFSSIAYPFCSQKCYDYYISNIFQTRRLKMTKKIEIELPELTQEQADFIEQVRKSVRERTVRLFHDPISYMLNKLRLNEDVFMRAYVNGYTIK